MEQDEEESGGATLVTERLLDPLARLGMAKPRKVSAEAHADMLGRLKRHLAYMTPEELDMLAAHVERFAGGKAKNEWPAEITIRNLARLIRPSPGGNARLVESYMRSAAGRRAWDQGPGHAVALAAFLAAKDRPPYVHDARLIAEEGEDLDRRARFRGRRLAEGRADGVDREQEDAWRREVARVRGLVFPGQEATDAA